MWQIASVRHGDRIVECLPAGGGGGAELDLKGHNNIGEGADANDINDVHVDENGIMYVVDRLQGRLYILELNL